MVGNVGTQTRRSTPLLPYVFTRRDTGSVWSSGELAPDGSTTYLGKQTTTSYRSTRAAVGVEKEYQQALSEILTRGHNGESFSRPYDTGHEFSTIKQELLLSHKRVNWFSGRILDYSGPLICVGNTSRDTRWIAPPKTDLILMGTRAIAKTNPTNPAAGMSTFLGELREGFPSLSAESFAFGHWDNLPKKLGGEYLNYQFGWLPLIADLQKFLTAASNSTRIIEQFARDSGHNVRRRYTFPDEHSTVDPVATAPTLLLSQFDGNQEGWFGRSGTSTMTVSTRKHSWFSGSYTYYLEQGKDLMSRMKYYEQQANHLLGTRITPEVLWELTPWSWLADWYTDLGSIIANASALQSDGLVMRYGYVMQTSVTDVVHRHTDIAPAVGGWTPGAVVNTFRTTRKERIRATPYGFGLKPESFTVRQWAILGALGMTKSPNSLR